MRQALARAGTSVGARTAFAGSMVLEGDNIWLYYSQEDSKLLRALIRKTG